MVKSSSSDFINQMFPVEASLSGLEPFMQKIHNEIRRVDDTILVAIRQQSNSGTKAKDDLADATCAVEELAHKIQEIKSKAEQTEAMVQDVCRDIKKLDFAKKNITTAVTALHRLKMVVSAVEQLQMMTSKRQYKEAAAQLEAVNELCNHFKAYMDVPKLTELREKLKNIKNILKSHIFSDFSSLGTGIETEEKFLLMKLSDSCLVVDALEPSVREELINNFCSRELTSYEQLYVGAELNKFDEIEQIYNQISCHIRTNQEKWRIFPASWHVSYRLCIQLCKITRDQVDSILVNMTEKLAVERLLQLFFKLSKGGTRKQIKASGIDERVICYIVNSADYCRKTSGDLGEEVSTIIDPHYADSVDMSEVQDKFSCIITKALMTLVRGLETKFDIEMQEMACISWGTLESVGDHSQYVNGIYTILNNSVPVLKKLLTPVYFQFFLEKLASSLGLRFYANIFRCKKISETGAHQMLLDTQAMEMILLKVPSLDRQTVSAASYSEFVKLQMSRAEAVLKVILSPIESVADTYSALFPKGTPMKLQRILDLKGLTKANQQSILDDFNKHAPRITQPSVAAEMPQPVPIPPAPPIGNH